MSDTQKECGCHIHTDTYTYEGVHTCGECAHQWRAAKSLGSGMYVQMQFDPKDLVKGDTYFDGDYGDVTWSGTHWCAIQLTMVKDELLPMLRSI